MRTIAITGAASGIGAAVAARLSGRGERVLTVDLRDAEVVADLGTPAGREHAAGELTRLSGGRLDGVVTSAGLAGTRHAPAAPVVSVNYFGTVTLLDALRPALAGGDRPAAVCLSSNSATCQPNWPVELAEACLAGDERAACALADEHGGLAAYPATKAAVAWYVRGHAPGAGWAGAGIRLNAVAPGFVDTPMTARVREDPDLAAALDAFPVPRQAPGTPEEVAAVVDFLLGPDAALLYGSVVYADGGTDALLRARDWPRVWSV
ncbi:NAD(P)-dependent dehydrogenase (short-subunit alcohol dehydrogenase family) [Prauserella shujinwangii]|uniref:NAD(P)-dependent dehydrogenase (Short-subunit alcohol dehydrogenase family) n=1 Tax=Prauserella shujinwangii TaxID=1453103 RepID=A0A2T0M2L4_9PSEU|nr:SDR family oxidoreductase [Prauserella shujinwangii]PRX50977.1 NAD(P)-dependent dehydrogenase (short-subunit alcohol dehydrogenase family) [Prauserella shujinwangii]